MESAAAHVPVLLHEVLDLMHVRPHGTYIDATFGRGGHSCALLHALDRDGRLVVIDRDPEALACAYALAADDPRVIVVDAAYSNLAACGLSNVDGILFDIGCSSPQIDDPARGFSFRRDGPLDMRMDPRVPGTAADWVNTADERELADVLWRYGEERRSRQIARTIVAARRRSPLLTTTALATVVRSCFPYKGGRIDAATRTFQALRIFINDELGELERALEQALAVLAVGGRVLVIAFHSLEDRLVKRRFRDLDQAHRDDVVGSDGRRFQLLGRRAVQASDAEAARNPRARSARLRALERCA